ncbi:hypothetical protein PDTK01_36440 [Phycicoccus sp. DTK01]|nr:hypothetical protein PDTK01_36440 [Phycicoccus sp. DTK01]
MDFLKGSQSGRIPPRGRLLGTPKSSGLGSPKSRRYPGHVPQSLGDRITKGAVRRRHDIESSAQAFAAYPWHTWADGAAGGEVVSVVRALSVGGAPFALYGAPLCVVDASGDDRGAVPGRTAAHGR